jgi:hypothetical protein
LVITQTLFVPKIRRKTVREVLHDEDITFFGKLQNPIPMSRHHAERVLEHNRFGFAGYFA